MEKIDQHIESKEKVDLERYSKMERRMNRLFQKYSKMPGKVIERGQPYGALEEKLIGKRLNPALDFALTDANDQEYELIQPWLELLTTGYFSEASLAKTPLSFQSTM